MSAPKKQVVLPTKQTSEDFKCPADIEDALQECVEAIQWLQGIVSFIRSAAGISDQDEESLDESSECGED